MTERGKYTKRRKHERFEVAIDAFAESESNGLNLGKVVNIGLNGFAVRCKENKTGTKQSLSSFIKKAFHLFSLNDFMNLSIRIDNREDYTLERMPCKIVADFQVTRHSPLALSQRCFKFGALRHDQLFHLKKFIKNHTGEALKDRRSGRDRRKYDSPQFISYIKRLRDRRKWWEDRRQSIME